MLSALIAALCALGACQSPLLGPPPAQGSWELLSQVNGVIFTMDFISPQDGEIVAKRDLVAISDSTKPAPKKKPGESDWVIYETHDGGVNFTPQDPKAAKKLAHPIRFLKFADKDNAWALDEDNSILHTSDGGQSWQAQRKAGMVTYTDSRYKNAPTQKTREPIESLDVVNASVAFAYGGGFDAEGVKQDGVLLATTDGGKTWNPLKYSFLQNIQCSYFKDATHGWVYDAGGSLYRTTDGGKTWVVLQTGNGKGGVLAIYFISADEGWLVGKSSDLRHTTDGGKTWEKQKTPVQSNLRAVVFLDQNRGWVAGSNGVFLGTTDGGRNWYKQSNSVTDEAIVEIDAVDQQTILAASQNGTILKYAAPK